MEAHGQSLALDLWYVPVEVRGPSKEYRFFVLRHPSRRHRLAPVPGSHRDPTPATDGRRGD